MATNSVPTFAVASRDKIQGYISEGILKYPSYVLCKHEYTWVFIDKELQIHNVEGYGQASMFFVDELPEVFKDRTFYVCNGIGYLGINGKLVPVFRNISEGVGSYNDLADIPVTNKVGSLGAEIILSDLDDGNYNIKGHYKIGGNSSTVSISSANTMFLIESDDTYKYITKLGAKKVYIYKIDIASGEVVTDEYITKSWIEENGYTNRDYVNQAIEDLYQRISNEALITITKLSQLENDCGFITAEEIPEIENKEIFNLF